MTLPLSLLDFIISLDSWLNLNGDVDFVITLSNLSYLTHYYCLWIEGAYWQFHCPNHRDIFMEWTEIKNVSCWVLNNIPSALSYWQLSCSSVLRPITSLTTRVSIYRSTRKKRGRPKIFSRVQSAVINNLIVIWHTFAYWSLISNTEILIAF